jgi:hypothetical protein
MDNALPLSIMRGRGDVVMRFIVLLSADAGAMQRCKNTPASFDSEVRKRRSLLDNANVGVVPLEEERQRRRLCVQSEQV